MPTGKTEAQSGSWLLPGPRAHFHEGSRSSASPDGPGVQEGLCPGPAVGGGQLALEPLQDVVYEEPPLQLQQFLEVVDAGRLVAICLPSVALELAAGCPAAPAGPHHLLGQPPLQQLPCLAELSRLPVRPLAGLCCPLPLFQLLQLLRAPAARHRAPAGTITAEGVGSRPSATKCCCQQSPTGAFPASLTPLQQLHHFTLQR